MGFSSFLYTEIAPLPNLANLVFEQQYSTLASFRPPETSPFRIDFWSKNCVFSRHGQGPHFSSFYVDLCWKMRFWDPLQNPMGSKMAPKIDQWVPKGVKKANYVRRSCITWSQSLPRRLLKCSQAFCSAFWHDLRSLLDKFWLNVNVSLYYIEASGTHAVSVPETTLRPRRRLKRSWSHFSWFLKDFRTLQASCWRIFNDSRHRFLY